VSALWRLIESERGSNPAHLIEDVEHMAAAGESPARIVERVRLNASVLEQALRRADRPDLAALISPAAKDDLRASGWRDTRPSGRARARARAGAA
jgi:hypothetical protein